MRCNSRCLRWLQASWNKTDLKQPVSDCGGNLGGTSLLADKAESGTDFSHGQSALVWGNTSLCRRAIKPPTAVLQGRDETISEIVAVHTPRQYANLAKNF